MGVAVQCKIHLIIATAWSTMSMLSLARKQVFWTDVRNDDTPVNFKKSSQWQLWSDSHPWVRLAVRIHCCELNCWTLCCCVLALFKGTFDPKIRVGTGVFLAHHVPEKTWDLFGGSVVKKVGEDEVIVLWGKKLFIWFFLGCLQEVPIELLSFVCRMLVSACFGVRLLTFISACLLFVIPFHL